MSYKAHEKTIRTTLQYIEHHLTDQLPLHTLAKQAGYSRFHFHRVFQAIVGKSVVDYIRERRLAQAATDLITTDHRVIDIALLYGFGSQESFTRAFKKIYQMTPGQYRKLLKHLILKEEFLMENQQTAPEGWILTGLAPEDYEAGLDSKIVHTGMLSGFLKSKSKDAKSFGTLMQQIKADHYRGKRLQFSAFVKSENVKDWAGLWMRVDHFSETLAFDNMMNRPIKGTNEWNRYSVVLDVPSNSDLIAFGVLLNGDGHVWMDGLRFETVDESVPTTDSDLVENLPEEPVNLNFEMKSP